MATHTEINDFLKLILKQLDAASINSSHVTLHVFQFIEHAQEGNALVWARYRLLIGRDEKTRAHAHRSLGQGIKRLLNRENLGIVTVSPGQCSLVKSYMAFKPL